MPLHALPLGCEALIKRCRALLSASDSDTHLCIQKRDLFCLVKESCHL